MFLNNLRRLGYLAVKKSTHFTLIQLFKPSKSIRNVGGICLIFLPIEKLYSQQIVHCYSTVKSQRKSEVSGSDMAGNDDYKKATSIYDFQVKDTFGNDVSLDKYKDHVVLIVNIASKCGLTKNNYKELTELKEKYHDKGLRILNFPCNQFSSQMPEADGEEMVCHLKDAKADIGDVFQKIDVNGNNAHPLYKYLKDKQGGTLLDAIKWNFTKFLVDKNGQPVKRYAPTTNPLDIAKDIEELL